MKLIINRGVIMIGNDWDEKLKVIWNSDGFKKFFKTS